MSWQKLSSGTTCQYIRRCVCNKIFTLQSFMLMSLLLDDAASMEGYRSIAGGEQRGTLLQTEQAWLAATRPDLVVSDVVPLACAAARAAGLPCICVSNFSWGADLIKGLVCCSVLQQLYSVFAICSSVHPDNGGLPSCLDRLTKCRLGMRQSQLKVT